MFHDWQQLQTTLVDNGWKIVNGGQSDQQITDENGRECSDLWSIVILVGNDQSA